MSEQDAVRERDFDAQEMRRSLVALRLRVVATSMLRIEAGIRALGTVPALAEQLHEWSEVVIYAERYLALAPAQPSLQPQRTEEER